MGKQLPLDLRESPIKLVCDYCGMALVTRNSTTGGGVNATGETLCNTCCAFADVIDMVNTDPGQRAPIALYYEPETVAHNILFGTVSNWPGSLKLTVITRSDWARGGFGSKRRTVRFYGPHGSVWSGVEFNGNAGNLLRNLRRLKP